MDILSDIKKLELKKVTDPPAIKSHTCFRYDEDVSIVKGVDYRENNHYRLTADIGVDFYANLAQLESMKETARKQILRVVYGEVFSRIVDIETLVMSGNVEEVLKICKDVKNRIS